MAGHAGVLRMAPPQLSTVDVQATPEELLARAALGDEVAFAALYDELAGPVLGMVGRVLRDRAQSEEVAQETMLEIWRKAATFSPDRGNVRSWALTIAHRRAIDRVRSEQSGSDREARAGRLDPHRDFDEVAEQTMLRLEREDVRAALASLTDLQRRSIELAYYDGYTYREVGALLDIPVSTVKSRMRDGLIRLRHVLGARA